MTSLLRRAVIGLLSAAPINCVVRESRREKKGMTDERAAVIKVLVCDLYPQSASEAARGEERYITECYAKGVISSGSQEKKKGLFLVAVDYMLSLC